MCGFVGISNFRYDISDCSNVLGYMTSTISRRGPDEDGFFISKHTCFGHRRLIIIDAESGKQPMSIKHGGLTYTIVYNGQIYNTPKLRKELIDNGFDFFGYCDTEVLLKAFICFGSNIFHRLNGIFSFAILIEEKNELYLVRDHFGIKPLYYYLTDDTLIFGSEIKAILAHPKIQPQINETGLCELFGIGPAHSPGQTVFKNIKELKPAHFAIFNIEGFETFRYWKLESKPHLDNFEKTCETINYLLSDSIEKQLVSDVPLCSMLSGGLDSSIITAYASNYYRKNNLSPLKTFSVDYVDNDKNFVKSDFQPNSDKFYIDLMSKTFNTIHHTTLIDTPELANALEAAMQARDYPGMADVDSSMLLFCKDIKKYASVALSGECADEIFGGYPWFFRKDALESNTFPWSIAIYERQELLNPNIRKKINLKDYIDYKYNESLSEVTILDTDSKEDANKRKLFHLNLNWFMQTLLDRSDRMSMYSGLELRVPFCDYRLVEYVWNIPWEMKALYGREKGLLRYIAKKFLPEEIVERKKSPYPKTHNPNYLVAVKKKLSKILSNPNAPINTLLDRENIKTILKSDGSSFSRPWFRTTDDRSTINGLSLSG